MKFTDPPLEHLYFRVATGKLVPAGVNAWRLNYTLTLRINRTFAAILRPLGVRLIAGDESDGKQGQEQE